MFGEFCGFVEILPHFGEVGAGKSSKRNGMNIAFYWVKDLITPEIRIAVFDEKEEKMKKKLLVSTLILCFVLGFAGCGAKNGGDNGGETITIRVADVCAPGSPYDVGTAKFKEIVESESDGRITVNCYHGDMTTDEIEGTEMVQTGNLEMLWTSMGSLNGFAPVTDIMQLPFLFDSPAHLEKCLNGEFGEKILGEISQIDNIEAIAFHQDGWRNITTTGKEINTLEDVKGLKIRSMMSEMLIDMYKALGAVPTSVSYSELFTALQTGLVEGQDNSLTVCESDGFDEVLKSACINNLFYAGGVVLASDEWLDSLSEEDRELVISAAKEAGAYQREWTQKSEESITKTFEKEGWTITYPEDKDAWVSAVQSVYDKYVSANPEWEELLDLIESEK